jgi:hypothetical protein
MNHLHIAAQLAVDKDFINYVYLSGTLDPVVQRLLKIIENKQAWQDVFEDFDTPAEIHQALDNVTCDLRSAEEMIKEQDEEIKRLTTRTVIELLADQEQKLILAKAQAADARQSLDREQRLRKAAEEKLNVWDILQN